jgi:hypothetical protein
MTIQTTVLGYRPALQELVWSGANNTSMTAYLWGGGGGGGGNDSNPGGAGQGGGFARIDFSINNGDRLLIAVGGGGTAGGSRSGGAAGGTAGSSAVSRQLLNTRFNTPDNGPVISGYTNGAWCNFLNTYGVWAITQNAANFDRTYTINVPIAGDFTVVGSCDNFGDVFIDGSRVLHMPGFQNTYSTTVPLTAGTHVVRIVGTNTGGPGGVAVTIAGGESFSGGNGGRAGFSGSSGGGGGGGGATAVSLNGIIIAAAGGGGGGGGGGNRGAAAGQNAPGSSGQAAPGVSSGQDGTDKFGDGGGGGGGGGGWAGGNGGFVPSGDQGGFAGVGGSSLGSEFQDTNNRTAANNTSPFYQGTAGQGGAATQAGSNGLAVIVAEIPGVFVHDGSKFVETKQTWIKRNNEWVPVNITYIKNNNIWNPVLGSFAPTFELLIGQFGIESRPQTFDSVPTFSFIGTFFVGDSGGGGGWESGGFDGGGGGGGDFGGTNGSAVNSNSSDFGGGTFA